jgi:hypothetical protein
MTSLREGQLRCLAESYTAAGCSQNAARVAGFYSLDGSLRVNADATSVGRMPSLLWPRDSWPLSPT